MYVERREGKDFVRKGELEMNRKRIGTGNAYEQDVEYRNEMDTDVLSKAQSQFARVGKLEAGPHVGAGAAHGRGSGAAKVWRRPH